MAVQGTLRAVAEGAPAVVERHAADHLHVVVAEPQDTPARLAHHGEGLIEDGVLALAALRGAEWASVVDICMCW